MFPDVSDAALTPTAEQTSESLLRVALLLLPRVRQARKGCVFELVGVLAPDSGELAGATGVAAPLVGDGQVV